MCLIKLSFFTCSRNNAIDCCCVIVLFSYHPLLIQDGETDTSSLLYKESAHTSPSPLQGEGRVRFTDHPRSHLTHHGLCEKIIFQYLLARYHLMIIQILLRIVKHTTTHHQARS